MRKVFSPFFVIMISFYGCTKDNIETSSVSDVNCHYTSITSEDSVGNITFQEYLRDSNGHIVVGNFYSNGDLTVINKNYRYDQFGMISYYETYKKGELTNKTTKTFLLYKKPLTIIHENVNGKTSRSEFSYDSRKNLILQRDFYNAEFISENKNFEHDEYGNTTYSETFSSDGILTNIFSANFLSFGKPIQIVRDYVLSGFWVRADYSYDFNENLKAVRHYFNDELSYESKNFQHNKFGYEIYSESYFMDGKLYYKSTKTYLCKE